MLWLYLHFPSLQLDALFRDNAIATQPLIIVDGKHNEVVQLNAAAQKEGIKVGMGLGAAASLCHQLQVKPYKDNVERKLLKRIAHWLYPVTADITLFQPNGLLLRVSSMLTFHHDLTSYWSAVSRRLNKLTIHYQYATGHTPLAARLLSQQAMNTISDDKLWLTKQIEKQPLCVTDLPVKENRRLQKTGVRTLSDLLSLSLPDLSKRFNIEVVNYIGKLTGQVQHQVNFYIPPSGFEHYLELYYEISNHLYLEKPLLKLYHLLETYLRHKDILATELLLRLHQRDNDDLSVQVTAAQGEYKADKWWQLTQLSLESIKLASPIVAITIKAKQLANKYAQRHDLFSGSQGHQSPEELIAILTAKLGAKNVRGICIAEDDRPEVANQLCQPLVNPSTKPNTAGNTKLRPTLLMPKPLPLNEQVTLISQPERIITGWWDNNEVVRDYFVARSEQGRWLWLFRDHKHSWFVHGVFS